MSNEMPAVGDDRLAIANQLLRLADQFSDKTGLAMYLRVAANLLRRADEVIRLRAADGWQLVPKEPTEEMIVAGVQTYNGIAFSGVPAWHAMLAAAPKVAK